MDLFTHTLSSWELYFNDIENESEKASERAKKHKLYRWERVNEHVWVLKWEYVWIDSGKEWVNIELLWDRSACS